MSIDRNGLYAYKTAPRRVAVLLAIRDHQE